MLLSFQNILTYVYFSALRIRKGAVTGDIEGENEGVCWESFWENAQTATGRWQGVTKGDQAKGFPLYIARENGLILITVQILTSVVFNTLYNVHSVTINLI